MTGQAAPGIAPTFRHVDDIEWTEVQRQRNANGSVSSIRERWPIIRPDFLSAYVRYEPGMIVRRHGHRSNHVVFVLDGGGWIGGDWCERGTHIHVPLGAAFGPIVAGPDGLICWELSFGEFGGWGDQLDLYERELAARGVTPLPDPPLDLGDWFVDPRGDVGAERATPKVDGLSETVTRLDDVAWRDVAGAPGGTGPARVRERRLIDQPDFTSAYVDYAAGAALPRHRRRAPQVRLVVAGGAWFGDRWCPAGTHVEVPEGALIGPIVAGDEGMSALELTDGDASVQWDASAP